MNVSHTKWTSSHNMSAYLIKHIEQTFNWSYNQMSISICKIHTQHRYAGMTVAICYKICTLRCIQSKWIMLKLMTNACQQQLIPLDLQKNTSDKKTKWREKRWSQWLTKFRLFSDIINFDRWTPQFWDWASKLRHVRTIFDWGQNHEGQISRRLP